MMTRFCVFRLYGQMASYGDVAVGEVRQSFGYPSKSSVLGLVAAALGIRRDEEAKLSALSNGFNFGVLVESSGTLIQDFHTVQSPNSSSLKKSTHVQTRRDELRVEKIETIISRRDYLCDLSSVVFLWESGKDYPYSLDDIPPAFHTPVFTLYLGRKSCPLSLPVQAMIISASSLEEAYAQYPPSHILDGGMSRSNRVKVYWEGDPGMVKSESRMQVTRRDHLRSRRRWQYSDRNEWYSVIPLPEGA